MATAACANTASNAWPIGWTLTGAAITSLAPWCRASAGRSDPRSRTPTTRQRPRVGEASCPDASS
jgi:hypothetical protein